MDVSQIADMSGALSAQRIAQQAQTLVLLKVKDMEKQEMSMAAKLLGSVPNAQPDGVGGNVDFSA